MAKVPLFPKNSYPGFLLQSYYVSSASLVYISDSENQAASLAWIVAINQFGFDVFKDWIE